MDTLEMAEVFLKEVQETENAKRLARLATAFYEEARLNGMDRVEAVHMADQYLENVMLAEREEDD